MNAYLVWKVVHVISASVLFGTGMGIAFFAWFGYRRALRNGEIEGLRSVLRLTVLADAFFTAPAVVIQFASGMAMLHINGWSVYGPWASAALALFVIVGLLWLPVVAIQIALSRAADRASSIAALPRSFHVCFRWWFALGVPAFLLVLIIFYLMVAKPLPLL